MRTLKEVFGVDKPIIGMLHLSGYGREKILENATREIEIMYRSGVNAILVENYFGDRVDVENALRYLRYETTWFAAGVLRARIRETMAL